MKEDKTIVPEIPKVFISYAWADELSALAIDQWLRNHGARVLIDRRDFIPGNDIEAEIVRCIRDAGKVVCIYSRNSANRSYPELERRITSALEREDTKGLVKGHRRLIYFCIDDTPLPVEALPRLAIRAAQMALSSACEELWRSILEKASPPKEFDLSKFKDKTPWRMDDAEQKDIAEAACKAMSNVFEGQQTGTTLAKWKMETYHELTYSIEKLPDEAKLSRIQTRLSKMVERDDEWEKRNTMGTQSISERRLAEPREKDEGTSSMAAGALASTMFHGVMEDNRKLHRIRRELLEDLETLVSDGKSITEIMNHIKGVLAR